MKSLKQALLPSLLPLALLVLGLGALWYWRENRKGADLLAPGQGPSVEEQKRLSEYDKKCPLETLLFEDDSENFKLISVDCSYNALSSLTEEGEEAAVEIYTQDLETGKQEFRNWLADNGLEESDKLRVTYEHKPR